MTLDRKFGSFNEFQTFINKELQANTAIGYEIMMQSFSEIDTAYLAKFVVKMGTFIIKDFIYYKNMKTESLYIGTVSMDKSDILKLAELIHQKV